MPPTADRRPVTLQVVATVLLAGVVAGLVVQATDVLVNRNELEQTGLSLWHWLFVDRWNYDAIVALGALGLALVAGGSSRLRRLNALLGAVPAFWLLVEAVVVVATGEPSTSWPRLTAGLIVEVVVDVAVAVALLVLCRALAAAPSSTGRADDG